MDAFISSLNALKIHLPIAGSIIGLLFIIQILNSLLGYRLNMLGLRPRKLWGLIGVPFSPFLHGNFAHFLFNSLPLFAFSSILLTKGIPHYVAVSTFVILISGLLLWLFGRPGIHIGASGVIMGYLGYIFLEAYYHPTPFSYVVLAVCLYYFGGLFFSIVPSKERQVSWDGHLFGLISGAATVFIFQQFPVVINYFLLLRRSFFN